MLPHLASPASLHLHGKISAEALIEVHVGREHRRAFLIVAGVGWTIRAVHSIIMGCVPVVVQDDGQHERVAQVVREASGRPLSCGKALRVIW